MGDRELLNDPLLSGLPVENGRVCVGPVYLSSKIGQGNMGAVYRGRHSRLKTEVAIKILAVANTEVSDALITRFFNEARACAAIDHHNLVRVFDINELNNVYYIIMELVEGENLEDKLERQGRLSEAEVLDIAIRAGEALGAAHGKGYIHRDIKPANIMIRHADGRIKVTDLGLAKLMDPAESLGVTAPGQIVGTPLYMSPEQADGNPDLDTRTDIYSLGATMYAMLAGQPPFKVTGIMQLLTKLATEEPPDIKGLVPGLRDQVCSLVKRMMAKEREERFASIDESVAEMRKVRGESSSTVSAADREPAFQALKTGSETLEDMAAEDDGSIGATMLMVKQQQRSREPGTDHWLRLKRMCVLSGHRQMVKHARFSPDCSRVLTASSDGLAILWGVPSGKRLGVLKGHRRGITHAQFSPGGRIAVTTSMDKTARLWDAVSCAEAGVLSGHEGAIFAAAFSPDGKRIATASDDGTVRVWDTASAKELVSLEGHEKLVFWVEFVGSGKVCVSASADKTARIWDVEAGKALAVLQGHSDEVFFAAVSPSGRSVLTTSRDGTARLWDVRSGAEQHVLQGHSGWVRWGAFSPDGKLVATASDDQTARIWDARTGEALVVLRGHSHLVWMVDFTPDGTHLVTASSDKTAGIWNVSSGKQISVMKGHRALVGSAEFSADGALVVTASADRTAIIWGSAG